MATFKRLGGLLAEDIAAGKLLAQRAAATRQSAHQSTSRGPESVTPNSDGASPARRARRMRDVTPEALQAKVAALLPHSVTQPMASPPACPQCGGAGMIRVAQISEETGWHSRLEPCGCQAKARWERARRASDITDKLLKLTFAGYDACDNAPALGAAQAWVDGAGREDADALPWLVFYGGYGTGKTHLLAAAFNALLASGRYPLYTVVPTLLDYLRNALDSDEKDAYATRLKAVMEAPILILDDLGAEKRTAWTDETLFKLLDYRYRAEAPTAVASNIDLDELEPRISSRLQDGALSTVVLMAGADYRKTATRAARTTRQTGGK